MTRIAVVGASLAGVNAAQAIRRSGFDDAICLIGDEPHQPYDRPPLSKQFLTTDFDPHKLLLRPTADPATRTW